VSAGDAAAVACRVLLGRDAVDVRELSCSSASAVCRVELVGGGCAIVKLHFGAARRRAREQQRAMAAVAAYSAVPTARVLACGAVPVAGAAALITSDLGRVDLGCAVRDGICSRDQALELMGRLLARLHRMPLEAGPRPPSGRGPRIDAPALIARCPAALADAVGPVLARAAAAARETARPVWCHGDLHPANVLLPQAAGGRLGPAHVIDFEQMLCAAPEYDLAQCLVTSDALTPGERARVEAAYGGALCPPLIDELIVFHAARGLVYAARDEGRDAPLWQARVHHALEHCLSTACDDAA
jgi:aminoglycoside phosphotransferase (APT) family kinase protein